MSDDNLKRAALRVEFRKRNPNAPSEVIDGLCDFAMTAAPIFSFDANSNLTVLGGDLSAELASFENLPTFADALSAPTATKPPLVADSAQLKPDLATGVFAAQQRENHLVEKIGGEASPPTPAWHKQPLSVEAVCQHHGISIAQFNAEPLGRRLDLTNAADGARRGFAS